MANILMINVFFKIAAGAEIVAAFVLMVSLLVLWQKRREFIALFWSDQKLESTTSLRAEWVAALIVALLLLVEAVVFGRHPAR